MSPVANTVPVVFDLDGTLVDTHKAVKMAYAIAGVEMPDAAWGKPWREWTTIDVHYQKEKAYPRCLAEHGKTLPLFDFVSRLKLPVITGASASAVSAIIERFGDLNVIGYGLSLETKLTWLMNMGPFGIYVDDLADARDRVERELGWTCLTPQDATRLFSPRVLTRGSTASFRPI